MNSRSSLFAFSRHLAAWFAAFSFLCAVPPTQAAPTTPTTDFTDNGDGTVTHRFTGLTWKRCIEGMTWTGTTCSGTASTYTWEQATALSTGEWRLPTANELSTLVEYSIASPGPAINTTVFPGTRAGSFWSASAYASDPSLAWHVDFYNGGSGAHDKTFRYPVRLVSSAQLAPVASSVRVFNWGASAYPHLFAPANADTQSLQGYTYRYYSGTNSYPEYCINIPLCNFIAPR